MEDYREVTWLMERILHKYMQYEKIPQRYCKDVLLTQPEIHTLAIVGDQKGINVTQLAKMRGITKGAASQMIYRLVDKGLVEKKVSPESDAAVCLILTAKGEQARKEHRNRHKKMQKRFASLMDAIPADARCRMITFLNEFEAELDGMK